MEGGGCGVLSRIAQGKQGGNGDGFGKTQCFHNAAGVETRLIISKMGPIVMPM